MTRTLLLLAACLALASCDHDDTDRTVPIVGPPPSQVQDCVRDEDNPLACPPERPTP